MFPAIVLTLLLAAGCAQQPHYKIYRIHDQFDDFRAGDRVENYLGGNRNQETVQLNISERTYPDGDPRYTLHVVYEAPHRLGIRPGESLVLLVDGKRIAFTSIGSGDN